MQPYHDTDRRDTDDMSEYLTRIYQDSIDGPVLPEEDEDLQW